jgi:hypothetical protein
MFQRLVAWAQGRHTLFAMIELAIGSALAWFGKLDMNFVALVGVIQGMILGHSVKEDYFSAKPTDKGDESK